MVRVRSVLVRVSVGLGVVLGVAGAARGQSIYEVLHAFRKPGLNPVNRLVQASDGNLYGTTASGGTANQGTIFRIDSTGAATDLHSFSCSGAATPFSPCGQGALMQGSDGSMHGTTSVGGAAGGGTIFGMDLDDTVATLHDFDCAIDFDCAAAGGCQPMAGLLQASDGAFYGVTSRGGPDDGGAVIEMAADGTVTTLHALDCRADGCRPQGRLIEGSDGYLYGTTSTGGPLGGGVVFRVNPHPGAPAAVSSPPCIEAPVSVSVPARRRRRILPE